MIDGARKYTNSLGLAATKQFEYIQSSAEDLRLLKDGSVDLIVAGLHNQDPVMIYWGSRWSLIFHLSD